MDPSFCSHVIEALKNLQTEGALTGWSLNETASRSLQRLYSSPEGATLACHQSRRVKGSEIKLSVFTPSETDGRVGTAMVDLVSYLPVEPQLAEVIEMAKGSQNKQWNLARPPEEKPQPVETCDPQVRDNPDAVAEAIEAEVQSALAATTGCYLNSAELFINHQLIRQTNSEGLSYESEQSDLYVEAAMEKAGQENDKEVHDHTTSVTVADLNVTDFINECALQVSVLGDSEEPETTDGATLLISKDALSQMLRAILQQLNCSNEYLKLPFLKKGDEFGGGDGDSLSLSLDPTIPSMVLSSAYAADGLPACRGCLIEKNVVQNRIIGNRFGQYLDLDPNGLSGNIVVEAGTLNTAELSGSEYIEIIKFSSLLIDAQKLTWSSEVKLGRQIAADGTATLIKGGIVSGNLKENFMDCKLSSTLGTVNVPQSSYDPPLGYRGPDAMLITRGVSIAGQTKGNA